MLSSTQLYANTPNFGRVNPHSILKKKGEELANPENWVDVTCNPDLKDPVTDKLDISRVNLAEVITLNQDQQDTLNKVETLFKNSGYTKTSIEAAQAYALDPELGKRKLAKNANPLPFVYNTLKATLFLNGLVECVQAVHKPEDFMNLDPDNLKATFMTLGVGALINIIGAGNYAATKYTIPKLLKKLKQ